MRRRILEDGIKILTGSFSYSGTGNTSPTYTLPATSYSSSTTLYIYGDGQKLTGASSLDFTVSSSGNSLGSISSYNTSGYFTISYSTSKNTGSSEKVLHFTISYKGLLLTVTLKQAYTTAMNIYGGPLITSPTTDTEYYIWVSDTVSSSNSIGIGTSSVASSSVLSGTVLVSSYSSNNYYWRIYNSNENTGSTNITGSIKFSVGSRLTLTLQTTQLSYNNLADVLFSDKNFYSYNLWPSTGGSIIPIGIRIPGTNYAIGLKYLHYSYPDNGSTGCTYIPYGGTGTDNSTSESDGKANTLALIALDNSNSTAWQTASSISNTASTYNHPLALCAWRYHPTGTNLGDWYIPSKTELITYINNIDVIAATSRVLYKVWGSSYVTKIISYCGSTADNTLHYEKDSYHCSSGANWFNYSSTTYIIIFLSVGKKTQSNDYYAYTESRDSSYTGSSYYYTKRYADRAFIRI